MRNLGLFVLVGLLTTGVACGGSSGGGTNATLTGATGPDGTPAVYHSGPLPAPTGSLTVSVPSTGDAINGGSITVSVTGSSATITAVYVSVMGQSGYWQVSVPAGSSVADVLLTLAQHLGSAVTIVFEAGDASGDISAPVATDLSITTVGTGDIQVSVSWDADNDLDLHVLDPNGFEVYFGDRTSPEGGMLDLDSNAGCDIDGVNNENIVWPSGKAPHGTYTVSVDNYENCTGTQADYVVTVQKTGAPPMTFSGSFLASDPGDFDEGGVVVTTFTF